MYTPRVSTDVVFNHDTLFNIASHRKAHSPGSFLKQVAPVVNSAKHQRLLNNATTSTSCRDPDGRDQTREIGDDIFALVATFANPKELCRLGCLGRRFRHIPLTEHLWELRALEILPRAQLEAAKVSLGLTSYRQVVEVSTRIRIPHGVLGFWRADAPSPRDPPWAPHLELLSQAAVAMRASDDGGTGGRQVLEDTDARGELLRISFSGRGFLCESISPSGNCRG